VPDGFAELGGFEFSSVFVVARSSPFSLQGVGSFCCFLHTQGVCHIVCVCVPVWLVVECASVGLLPVIDPDKILGHIATRINSIAGGQQERM
jgi:hypothetical protein